MLGADHERTVIPLIELPNGSPFIVYGTVLPWKGDGGVYNWDEHHRVIEKQTSEWLEVVQKFPGIPICIAGDFNTDMETGGYYGTKRGIAALKKALSNIGCSCVTAMSLIPACMLDQPPIDHIALSDEWASNSKVISAWRADKRKLTDHSGLIVEINRYILKSTGTAIRH
ncbi:MAG: hypothetical protein Hens3KO_05670 [Henriciella sp.]